jgi:hypothetical protein
MKSLALTLAVLLSALSVVHADDKTAPKEEVVLEQAAATAEVPAEEAQQPK